MLEYSRTKMSAAAYNISSLNYIDSVRGPVYLLQWEDKEIYSIMKKALTNEKDLLQLLRRIPEPTSMH